MFDKEIKIIEGQLSVLRKRLDAKLAVSNEVRRLKRMDIGEILEMIRANEVKVPNFDKKAQEQWKREIFAIHDQIEEKDRILISLKNKKTLAFPDAVLRVA